MNQKNNVPEAQGAGKQLVGADKVKDAWMTLERVHYRGIKLSPEDIEAIKICFLPDASDKQKIEAYQAMMEPYEILISYSWKTPELHEDAFHFWNIVLKDDNTAFSGNSIIRVLSDRPNENLLKIFKNHQTKFTKDPIIKNLLYETIDRTLEAGYFDFQTRTCSTWSERERKIWVEILSLLK